MFSTRAPVVGVTYFEYEHVGSIPDSNQFWKIVLFVDSIPRQVSRRQGIESGQILGVLTVPDGGSETSQTFYISIILVGGLNKTAITFFNVISKPTD